MIYCVRARMHEVGVILVGAILGWLVVIGFYGIRLWQTLLRSQRSTRTKQVFVLALLGLSTAAVGAKLIPSDESGYQLDNSAVISLSPSILMGQTAKLEQFEWYEVHDDYTGSPALSTTRRQKDVDGPINTPPPGIIRVGLLADFDSPLDPGTRTEFTLSLPRNVELVRCSALDGMSPCSYHSDPVLNRSSGAEVNTFWISARQVDSLANVGFVLDFKGSDGLAFRASRAHVSVRLPFATPEGWFYESGRAPIQVVTHLGIEDPRSVSWQNPGPQNSEGPFTTWTYELSDIAAGPPPPYTGVKDFTLEHDKSREFWAGILLAIAGSAFIAVVQEVI